MKTKTQPLQWSQIRRHTVTTKPRGQVVHQVSGGSPPNVGDRRRTAKLSRTSLRRHD
jgi:hypothetical protein